jgi:GNAT superfamily N-acetyltransferase
MSAAYDTLNLPQSLGDGLVLRLATPADTEALVDFNIRVQLDEDEGPELISAWIRDLISGRHPTTTAANFVVVEDTKAGKIVSCTCLIPQVWAYEDIPFPVGRPELVGTHPAYRRRGLIRAILGKIHALSGASGHLVQGITGIPWFYRQFGYEYALPLGGGRILNINDVPTLKEGETEPYQIRQAIEEDVPTLVRLYQRACAGKLVTTVIDEAQWRYDLSGRSEGSDQEIRVYCILGGEGRVVGYFSTPAHLWRSRLDLWEMVVDEGVSLRAILPSVTRTLKAQGEAYAASTAPGKIILTAIRFALGLEHPAYEAFDVKLGPLQRPYSLYIRVPDLPGFICHIAPVLERRLANSVMSGFSGELKITFYRGGLRLVFEQGKLTGATDWSAPETGERWDGAGFPPLVFLQLLFGHRSLEELRYAFPDCRADEEPALLLNALFPKQASWVLPLG